MFCDHIAEYSALGLHFATDDTVVFSLEAIINRLRVLEIIFDHRNVMHGKMNFSSHS